MAQSSTIPLNPLALALLRGRPPVQPVYARPNPLAALFATPAMNVTEAPVVDATSRGWDYVAERFQRLSDNLLLTPRQRADAMTKAMGVVRCLNAHYYGIASETANAGLIGSWAKGTQTRPPRDVDLYFYLPAQTHARFQARYGNRQSDLLQEVKSVLTGTYPSTEMRGDGQVVVVRFESYSVEVAPAFQLTNGNFWICDTHDGGSYSETCPGEELRYLDAVDSANGRNLRPLIRMLKAWQAYCNVPIKSFHLELVAAQFLAQSPWRLKGWFYYDWLVRDFFAYLLQQHVTVLPGTKQLIFLGDDWRSRADTAYGRAIAACENEKGNYQALAGDEWQKIFGPYVPVLVR